MTGRLLDRFGQEFPGPGPDPEPPAAPAGGAAAHPGRQREPGARPLRELVDDRPLAAGTRYRDAIAGLEETFADGTADRAGRDVAIELMRMPARRAPTSLAGQLRYIRDQPGRASSDRASTSSSAGSTWRSASWPRRSARSIFGSVAAAGGRRRADGERRRSPGPADEPEAFSSDSAWMPQVVLSRRARTSGSTSSRARTAATSARSTRSRTRSSTRSRDGASPGLWLIGLWERSVASERIKRMRGNPDAVASAYSLDDYRIADDLGGEGAYANLRDRAWSRGIRLASDMVPNHMGIDSTLGHRAPGVVPVAARAARIPATRSTARTCRRIDARRDRPRGPLLGRQRRRGRLQAVRPRDRRRPLRLPRQRRHELPVERHGAAGLPRRRRSASRSSGRSSPSPGASRSSGSMPRWFWPRSTSSGCGGRNRVRAAASRRAPSTRSPRPSSMRGCRSSSGARSSTGSPPRSPARCCWPRRSGCSRATSSGRSGCTASTTARSCTCSATRTAPGYRRVIKETLEFDPEILKRYVNFMSNPDEKTALEQFGKGDKYFGVATVLATLPGLPMLGHGQVQGFGEKYGMEFRRATLDEQPDPWLVDRHEREIFPLLHRRAWFAEAHDFLLYDLVTADGSVDEAVLAYSNGSGPAAVARPLPRPVRLDERLDPRLGGRTRARTRRSKTLGPAVARRRARTARRSGGIRRSSGTPGRVSNTIRSCRDIRRARSAGPHWTPTGATSSGSSARSATASPASGAGSPNGSAGRGAVARRRAARAPARTGPRAAPRGLRRRPGRGGPRRDCRRSAARRGGAPVRRVPRGGRRRNGRDAAILVALAAAIRSRAAAAMGAFAREDEADPSDAVVPAAATEPPDSALKRQDRAALLGWIAFGRMGELAPGADVAATSRALV